MSAMEWLNYHHLLYFWMVDREGGLAPAGKVLRLSQSALSGQIRQLEGSLGQSLFERRGRGIVLTEFGRYFATKATAILEHVDSVIADTKRWPTS